MNIKPYGQVHHFNWDHIDEDGELMYGFYWEILDADAHILSPLMGPYSTYLEAATACQAAWQSSHHG
jgi:hypothetical protein